MLEDKIVEALRKHSDILVQHSKCLQEIVERLLACERWIASQESKSGELTAHFQSEAKGEERNNAEAF